MQYGESDSDPLGPGILRRRGADFFRGVRPGRPGPESALGPVQPLAGRRLSLLGPSSLGLGYVQLGTGLEVSLPLGTGPGGLGHPGLDQFRGLGVLADPVRRIQ